MPLVIDETMIEKMLREAQPNYTVTSSNIGSHAISASPALSIPSGVSRTVWEVPPLVSEGSKSRLLEIRRKIEASGIHLKSKAELDIEVAERKRNADR
jgi:hypothetical protein